MSNCVCVDTTGCLPIVFVLTTDAYLRPVFLTLTKNCFEPVCWGGSIAMSRCTWPTTVFESVVHVKWHPCPGARNEGFSWQSTAL